MENLNKEHLENSSLGIQSRQSIFAKVIFASRWLQLPIYLGLIIVQGIYAYKFLKSLWHLMVNLGQMGETQIMLAVLGLIDVVMIANLLVMVVVGGYETFVSRLNIDHHPDQPEWLNHVNASVLKVKLSMAIISISSIHLLQTFINADNISETTMKWQLLLHLGFLASTIAIAYTDKLLHNVSSH
ncbi:TIGR00645 family protein [Moraxella oblonga]|uniref:TIGR00645 family protein n=1 Tax=Moraxella oblonga TaxID=200413 RepID=UPI00082A6B8F|nr:TIGR00645 family protein [Moraxella oblonga]